MVSGADLKVAGVRAGKIDDLAWTRRRTARWSTSRSPRRASARCARTPSASRRPQSLIGEYYIDCKPGTSAEKLKPGSTIPVEQTASTIPLDLVNNVLRKPYRERLAIILDELGIGVAGRAQDINDVIRRASPALRETDKVLEKLARQNATLKQLVTDADTVVGDLADNRKDVGRFVVETKQAADRLAPSAARSSPTASAGCRPSCASCARRWPTSAPPPTPTRPPLRNLDASADQLATLLENLKPFTEATQGNLKSLAEASRKGRPAVSAARPVVAELTKATAKAPELANNSAIVLEHLDDRKHAAEKDPRSPGGQGYTGFEAVLQWVFDQSQAINIFDENGYMLKVALFESKCSDYQNLQTAEAEDGVGPELLQGLRRRPRARTSRASRRPTRPSTGRQFASQARAEGGVQREGAREEAQPKPEKKAPETKAPASKPPVDAKPPVDVDKLTPKQLVALRKDAIKRLRDAARKGTQDLASCASGSRTSSASSCRRWTS